MRSRRNRSTVITTSLSYLILLYSMGYCTISVAAIGEDLSEYVERRGILRLVAATFDITRERIAKNSSNHAFT